MKKFLIAPGVAALLFSAEAAQGPYNISVGSGDGSLAFSLIYSDGSVIGDDGMFDPAGPVTSDYTVYRVYFMIHNVTDNTTFWGDNVSTHLPKIPDGTISTNPSGFMNSAINFGNGLIGGLGVALFQPVPGESAGLQYTWSFGNTGTGPKTLRVIFFMDVDCYLDTDDYADDMCVRLANTFATGGGSAIAVGQGTANSSVDGLLGVKLESSLPATVYGVSDSAGNFGSTYYWENSNNFAGLGPEVDKNIQPSIANTVQNDADMNAAADVVGDVGGALQVELEIPQNTAPFLTFQALWGVNTTYSAGAAVVDWAVY